ncbi:MAG: hypothetical protein AAF696_32840 [Bacteroidota bacterium]
MTQRFGSYVLEEDESRLSLHYLWTSKDIWEILSFSFVIVVLTGACIFSFYLSLEKGEVHFMGLLVGGLFGFVSGWISLICYKRMKQPRKNILSLEKGVDLLYYKNEKESAMISLEEIRKLEYFPTQRSQYIIDSDLLYQGEMQLYFRGKKNKQIYLITIHSPYFWIFNQVKKMEAFSTQSETLGLKIAKALKTNIKRINYTD